MPVATSQRPPGARTAPARPQIAESLAPHELGTMIRRRSEHSELKTERMRPDAASIETTWPWYGGASPM